MTRALLFLLLCAIVSALYLAMVLPPGAVGCDALSALPWLAC